ncbi:hypothetical protein UY3_13495 [Chelonia mydas]|uniref:Uncharacterized protein n=1 Tax=Chelonia mydas TaxID=8469 RepID=M7BMI1_CHEMY|nr:hypothetical protein UY3_13495 [Chelonia mydas]
MLQRSGLWQVIVHEDRTHSPSQLHKAECGAYQCCYEREREGERETNTEQVSVTSCNVLLEGAEIPRKPWSTLGGADLSYATYSDRLTRVPPPREEFVPLDTHYHTESHQVQREQLTSDMLKPGVECSLRICRGDPSRAMLERGHDWDALPCRVKVKELWDAYCKAHKANSHSSAAPMTCRFYKELDAILGGDPI